MLLHPDKHAGAPAPFKDRLDLAFKKLTDARDADELQGTVPRTRTDRQRETEQERRRKAEERRAKQRERADAESARATAFQQEALSKIKVSQRAANGIRPWVSQSSRNHG